MPDADRIRTDKDGSFRLRRNGTLRARPNRISPSQITAPKELHGSVQNGRSILTLDNEEGLRGPPGPTVPPLASGGGLTPDWPGDPFRAYCDYCGAALYLHISGGGMALAGFDRSLRFSLLSAVLRFPSLPSVHVLRLGDDTSILAALLVQKICWCKNQHFRALITCALYMLDDAAERPL